MKNFEKRLESIELKDLKVSTSLQKIFAAEGWRTVKDLGIFNCKQLKNAGIIGDMVFELTMAIYGKAMELENGTTTTETNNI